MMENRSKVAVKDGLKKVDYNQYLLDIDRKAKEMKVKSNQMEKENMLMERKINTLKEKLRREKEDRERMGGRRWQSSQVNKVETKQRVPRRLKVLSDEPLENYKNNPGSGRGKDFPLCGQCEHKRAKVLCTECNENYCSSCYKEFHSKGALRKHSWVSLQDQINIESTRVDSAPVSTKLSATDDVRAEVISVTGFSMNKSPTGTAEEAHKRRNDRPLSNSLKSIYNNGKLYTQSDRATSDGYPLSSTYIGGTADYSCSQSDTTVVSLLNGTYDEKESAVSFQEVLREWRSGGPSGKKEYVPLPDIKTHSTSAGGDQPISTSANSNNSFKVNIKLNSSLTYMDKLMLKQHRKNPRTFTEKPSYSSAPTPNYQVDELLNNQLSPRELKTPSSCILALECSSPDFRMNQASINIDIFPMDNEAAEGESDEICEPIISFAEDDKVVVSDTTSTQSKENPISIVEVDFLQQTDELSPIIVHKSETSVDGNYDNKNTTHVLVTTISPTVATHHQRKQHSLYKDMGEYFTLGVLESKETINLEKENVETVNLEEQNISYILSNENTIWYPKKSFCDINEVYYNSTKTELGEAQCSSQRSFEYDYLKAFPPLSKEINHIHRASTSLSISALPVDVWNESDILS